MDYLNRLDTQYDAREVTTHDWRPSHNRRPESLIVVRCMADEAWADYDRIVEREYNAEIWELRAIDYRAIREALHSAEQLERQYSDLYDKWDKSR